MLEKLKLTCHSPQIKKTTSNKLCLSHLPCTICCTQATLKEKLPSFRGFLMVEHSEWKTKKCSYLVWCQHTSNRQNLSPSNDSLTYGDLLESLTELMRVLIIISIFFEAQQQQQQQLQQATATATTINLHKEHNNLVCLLMDFVISWSFLLDCYFMVPVVIHYHEKFREGSLKKRQGVFRKRQGVFQKRQGVFGKLHSRNFSWWWITAGTMK